MSCFTIRGTNNPQNGVHVNEDGEMATRSVILSEESRASEKGGLFTLTTGIIDLTDDSEVPFLYFKNVGEEQDVKILSIILTTATSTGAEGQPLQLRLYPNPTGGTLMSSPIVLPLANYNIGSGNVIATESLRGSVGDTVSGPQGAVPILIPSDGRRDVIGTDSIIIPRGRSFAASVQAATGNTSLLAALSVNLYLKEDS